MIINREHVQKTLAKFREKGDLDGELSANDVIFNLLMVVSGERITCMSEWGVLRDAMDYCNDRQRELFEEIRDNDLDRGAFA